MPLEGNDWLAQTVEPALEPELPICDPHHHFWDHRENRAPYNRYQVEELSQDLCFGHNMVSTVFIEARSMYRRSGPDALKPVGEVEYVNGQAAASASGAYGPAKIAAGIVGHADLLLGAEVLPVLEALEAAAPGRFRGIRDSSPGIHTQDGELNHKPEGQAERPEVPRRGEGPRPPRPHPRGLALLPSAPGAGRLRPRRSRPDNRPEPRRRAAAGGPYHTRIAEVEETWRRVSKP